MSFVVENLISWRGRALTTKGTKVHEGLILQVFFLCEPWCPSWSRI